MFYPARQEGQLDAALLYRRGQWQLGAGGSFKSPALRSAPSTGGLSHATVTIDALLPTVRVGVFGAKGLKRMDVVELSELLGP